MADRLQQFRNDVSDSVDRWRSQVTLPYIQAYGKAYEQYTATLGAQKDTDKANAELFVTAASIVTGTLLMATVATSSLRVLAGEAALTAVCKGNLTATFELMHATYNSPAAMFAIGKFLDEAKSQVTKEAQAIATRMIQSNCDVISNVPVVQWAQMEQFLINNKLCATDCAAVVERAPISDGVKNTAYSILRAAPIANPPARHINATQLAPRIELVFYMSMILNSDELIGWDAEMPGEYSWPRGKSHPIDVLPSDPKYPNPPMPRITGGMIPAHQSVGITRPGGKILDRIDELHRTVFGKPFYAGGWMGPPDTLKMDELRRAEGVLKQLGDAARPLNGTDVRV